MSARNFFLPHPKTHRKAYLISGHAILAYIALFLVLQIFFKVASHINPQILGVSSNVTVSDLINLTNQQRQAQGLTPVKENTELDQAAEAKAQNMFTENYWAHYSPSGKDPWGFILGSGYKFSYAGENLARNFYNSKDVVDAWMASPSHKANLLNSHYQDVGMAVEEGTLLGQPTILVVQEFGAPPDALAEAPTTQQPPTEVHQATQNTLAVNASNPSLNVANLKIDPYQTVRIVGLGLVLSFGGLLALDFLVLKKRGVYAVNGRHLPHFAILSVASVALLTLGPGKII